MARIDPLQRFSLTVVNTYFPDISAAKCNLSDPPCFICFQQLTVDRHDFSRCVKGSRQSLAPRTSIKDAGSKHYWCTCPAGCLCIKLNGSRMPMRALSASIFVGYFPMTPNTTLAVYTDNTGALASSVRPQELLSGLEKGPETSLRRTLVLACGSQNTASAAAITSTIRRSFKQLPIFSQEVNATVQITTREDSTFISTNLKLCRISLSLPKLVICLSKNLHFIYFIFTRSK